jgi:hypothetical protein
MDACQLSMFIWFVSLIKRPRHMISSRGLEITRLALGIEVGKDEAGFIH